MTDTAKVPTLDDIYESKDAMDDIQSFTYDVADTFVDAKSVTRDTVTGRIKKMGYAVPIAYAGGIVFAANDNVKTVEEAGVVYAPLTSSLPFTTSGIFSGDDDARFFAVQDSILEAKLADTGAGKGADIVNFKLGGIGAIVRSLLERAEHTVSVRDYGADEALANNNIYFQKAIDAVALAGGGDVEVPVPSSNWPTTGTITVKSGVNLKFLGNNMRGELRNYLLPSLAVSITVDTKEQSGLGLHQVAIDCSNLTSGSVGFNVKATQWLDARGCQADNVDIAGVIGWKIWNEVTDSQGCYWNTYYKCGSQGNNNVGTAWQLLGQTTGAKRLTTQTFIDCGGIGCLTNLDIDHVGSGIVWNNINMESAGGNGVEVDNSSSGVVVTFIGGEINGNVGWGITGTSDVLAVNLVDGANNTGGGTGDTDANVIHQRGNVLLDDATRDGTKAYHLANYYQHRESVVSYISTDSITPNKGQIRVSGNGGAVTLTSNPQIENPIGNQPQTLILFGGSNADTLTLVDGNGLRLGQNRKLDSESVLILSYSASFGDWIEMVYHSKTTQSYTTTNVTSDRSFDANTVTTAELADVVGTLISDLQAKGLLS